MAGQRLLCADPRRASAQRRRHVHVDAISLSVGARRGRGQVVLLTLLHEGQRATVLQLRFRCGAGQDKPHPCQRSIASSGGRA